MRLKEIRHKLSEAEKMIFEISFKQNKSLENLSSIYSNLLNLRKHFLYLNFMEVEQEELEEVRYRINESILNLKILIKEMKGLSIDLEISQMEELIK